MNKTTIQSILGISRYLEYTIEKSFSVIKICKPNTAHHIFYIIVT